MGIFKKSM